MKTALGAPRVPHGEIPHDTTPTRTWLGAAPWMKGPPKSPAQAESPPVNGPVQKFELVTKFPLKFKLLIAVLQSAIEIVDKIAFWRMFELVVEDPLVAPQPLKIPGPVGTADGCGNLIG